MIYTSYFANYKNYLGKYLRISTARYTRDGMADVTLSYLAPDKKLISDFKSGKINREIYGIRYDKQLDLLYVTGFLDMCVDFLKDKDAVLLCYEKPTDFCHRHLLASYLNKKYNLDIQELEYKRKE